MAALSKDEVLAMVPQRRPMRFIDEITELDDEHIIGAYTWKTEDCAGHSPEDGIVPPFKLIEMSAQIGNVAWCIYQMALEISPDDIRQLVGFFTQIEQAAFKSVVRPGDKVACMGTFGEECYFRGTKFVSQGELQFDGGPKDGEEIFSALISGLWVPKNSSGPR